MEEYLPLIIGIVWVVYTLYSRGQKKKTRSTPQPEKANRQPSLLEQILSGQGISIPEPEETDADIIYEYEEEPEIIINESVKEKDPKPFLSAELNNVKEEGESSFKNYFGKKKIEMADVEDDYLDLTEDMKDFDMRKAIIYSEILNAPYIDYK